MSATWALVYTAIGICEVLSHAVDLLWLHFITKPMLMPAIMMYYQQNATTLNSLSISCVGALICCWIGDIFLLMKHIRKYFMAGVVCFLIGHLLLIYTFYEQSWPQRTTETVSDINLMNIYLSIPPIVLGIVTVGTIYPYMSSLRNIVIVYGCIITLMAVRSASRYGYTSMESFWTIYYGSIIFLISDSLLAVNKFYRPLPKADVWIMSTYIVAVYMIIQGLLKHPQALDAIKP